MVARTHSSGESAIISKIDTSKSSCIIISECILEIFFIVSSVSFVLLLNLFSFNINFRIFFDVFGFPEILIMTLMSLSFERCSIIFIGVFGFEATLALTDGSLS